MNQTEPHEPDTQLSAGGRISPVIVIFLISGIIGLIAAGVMLLNERHQTPAQPTSPAQVSSLRDWRADDFELAALSGNRVRLSDFAGRVVFLNFWRTDCQPCVRELPAFQQFVQEQGDSGAVVLAINQGERQEDILIFLGHMGIENLLVLLDTDLQLNTDYPIIGLPTTYVIGKEGYVHYRKIGEMTGAEMDQYLDLLDDTSPARG